MKLKLRLTVDITYDVEMASDEEYLHQQLKYLPKLAAGEGMFTGVSDAEVDEWAFKVERVES